MKIYELPPVVPYVAVPALVCFEPAEIKPLKQAFLVYQTTGARPSAGGEGLSNDRIISARVISTLRVAFHGWAKPKNPKEQYIYGDGMSRVLAVLSEMAVTGVAELPASVTTPVFEEVEPVDLKGMKLSLPGALELTLPPVRASSCT